MPALERTEVASNTEAKAPDSLVADSQIRVGEKNPLVSASSEHKALPGLQLGNDSSVKASAPEKKPGSAADNLPDLDINTAAPAPRLKYMIKHEGYRSTFTSNEPNARDRVEVKVDWDGDFKVKRGDGKSLEFRYTGTGDGYGSAKGPGADDNYSFSISRDMRTWTVAYTDGRQITINDETPGKFQSMTSSGPSKFDNFRVNSDMVVRYWNPLATFQDWNGAKGSNAGEKAMATTMEFMGYRHLAKNTWQERLSSGFMSRSTRGFNRVGIL